MVESRPQIEIAGRPNRTQQAGILTFYRSPTSLIQGAWMPQRDTAPAPAAPCERPAVGEPGFTFSRVVSHQVNRAVARITAHGLITQQQGAIRADTLPSITALHLSIDHASLLGLKYDKLVNSSLTVQKWRWGAAWSTVVSIF